MKNVLTLKSHYNKVEIPARPFLKLEKEDLEEIKRKIIEYIDLRYGV